MLLGLLRELELALTSELPAGALRPYLNFEERARLKTLPQEVLGRFFVKGEYLHVPFTEPESQSVMTMLALFPQHPFTAKNITALSK